MHNTEMIVGDITVEIMRKANLKNLYITVTPPDGKVMVKSPMGVKEEEIRRSEERSCRERV